MTDFESQVLQELSVLKTQMQHLMGIGQPGRLHQLDSHERSVQRLKGLGAAFGGLLTLMNVAIEWLKGQHH
jgi:aminoglycoside phosphotransferase (APT) family kinase protein